MQCFIQVISCVSPLCYPYGTPINMGWLDELALFRGTLQLYTDMLKDANWSWTSWTGGLSSQSCPQKDVRMLCVHAEGRDIFVHGVFFPDIKVNEPLLLWGSDCHCSQKPRMSGTSTSEIISAESALYNISIKPVPWTQRHFTIQWKLHCKVCLRFQQILSSFPIIAVTQRIQKFLWHEQQITVLLKPPVIFFESLSMYFMWQSELPCIPFLGLISQLLTGTWSLQRVTFLLGFFKERHYFHGYLCIWCDTGPRQTGTLSYFIVKVVEMKVLTTKAL